MFMNDVHKKEEIRNIAVQDLKNFGIKFRPKKGRGNQHTQDNRNRKVFKMPLQLLPNETVTLPSGQQLVVPKIVHELCSYIVLKIDTEGLFRKGGSKSRQNEIKLQLDAGCYLGEEHHEIDVASVLKTFFRELPEPLIPYQFHELFLRCMLLSERQTEAVLLASLLLPTEHLNTLAYFMQFLCRVADYQKFNKMDSFNLAVVIGPTLLPAEEKLPHNPAHRLNKTCELFKLLIEHAAGIGVLSESVIERIALTSSTVSLNDDSVNAKRKKKRRSGSLTRMLSGLKKIVQSKGEDDMPDLLTTPCLTQSAKKRKVEGMGLSTKKRRDILSNLPQNAILNTPFTPIRTPVNSHPNAQKNIFPSASSQKMSTQLDGAKEKRHLWHNRSKSGKKKEDETGSVKSAGSIQRRWSAVSTAAGFRRKKTRNSCVGSISDKIADKDPGIDNRINDLSEVLTKQKDPAETEENYVKISKTEYEEIKNRVSAIERRISVELDNADVPSGIEEVEKAYTETVVLAEPMSPTTDQLARRLSRELKIRSTSESKVFRSPSARKIGSMRRRSRESNQVRRTQTWCVTNEMPNNQLRRGRPNTIQTGLPTPIDMGSPSMNTRSISSSVISSTSSTSWKSAQGFFSTPEMSQQSLDNCRASLAKLRSQNAGMVLAKAKLFDNLVDVEVKPVKMGAQRQVNSRQLNSSRVKTLRMEERRVGKKSMSPRRRAAGFKLRTKNEVDSPRCTTPNIKKLLNTKTPRRICCTPNATAAKQTPLKTSGIRFDKQLY